MFDIRLATTPAERNAVFRLRYSIYVEELQRKEKYADHASKTVVEPLDETGKIFGVWLGDQIVGTGRLNYLRDSDFSEYSELYSFDRLVSPYTEQAALSTKLMISKLYRASDVALNVVIKMCEISLADGIGIGFLDCIKPMEPFFKKLGYRMYKGRVQHPVYGDIAPMANVMDLVHLEAVGSPLSKICKKYPVDQAALEFFRTRILLLPVPGIVEAPINMVSSPA